MLPPNKAEKLKEGGKKKKLFFFFCEAFAFLASTKLQKQKIKVFLML